MTIKAVQKYSKHMQCLSETDNTESSPSETDYYSNGVRPEKNSNPLVWEMLDLPDLFYLKAK